MSIQLLLEKKHQLLKKKLLENLEKKHFVEMKINEQFEKLKRLEISLEKMQATEQSTPSRFALSASLTEEIKA